MQTSELGKYHHDHNSRDKLSCQMTVWAHFVNFHKRDNLWQNGIHASSTVLQSQNWQSLSFKATSIMIQDKKIICIFPQSGVNEARTKLPTEVQKFGIKFKRHQSIPVLLKPFLRRPENSVLRCASCNFFLSNLCHKLLLHISPELMDISCLGMSLYLIW